jgi:hypothetical protein
VTTQDEIQPVRIKFIEYRLFGNQIIIPGREGRKYREGRRYIAALPGWTEQSNHVSFSSMLEIR